MVERLPSTYQALGSIPGTKKDEEEDEEGEPVAKEEGASDPLEDPRESVGPAPPVSWGDRRRLRREEQTWDRYWVPGEISQQRKSGKYSSELVRASQLPNLSSKYLKVALWCVLKSVPLQQSSVDTQVHSSFWEPVRWRGFQDLLQKLSSAGLETGSLSGSGFRCLFCLRLGF